MDMAFDQALNEDWRSFRKALQSKMRFTKVPIHPMVSSYFSDSGCACSSEMWIDLVSGGYQ